MDIKLAKRTLRMMRKVADSGAYVTAWEQQTMLALEYALAVIRRGERNQAHTLSDTDLGWINPTDDL